MLFGDVFRKRARGLVDEESIRGAEALAAQRK
jgi:hypothetical protein